MPPLDRALRNKLEKTVKEARECAEAAAGAALEQLGVGLPAAPAHLNPEERELRRKLRAHGRQLGDSLNGGKTQTLGHLIEEVAYQHWHRMLFARFLAQNNLLMYPDPESPVAVTLEECEELAAEEGARDGWELAARFAAASLPQIFRLDSPVFGLCLPPEHLHRLQKLLADLPAEVFTASDSLGWVYQFWQANRKEQINKSELKIGARELPAVTQLFTEPYMVSFLLDNSLGAWWAARRLSESDLQSAKSEEELRQKAAIPGVPLEYLRFVKQEDGGWAPAAGCFDDWPGSLDELKMMDPCCGSGHFLVAALLMLTPMRMEMEGKDAREAVDAVLRENLHGLEIDQRCVEIAAFALALAAWNYPDAGGYRALPPMGVACAGLSVSIPRDEWVRLGEGNRNLSVALGRMYDTFRSAPVLGSLLNPANADIAAYMQISWDDVSASIKQALQQEDADQQQEAAVVAQGISRAADLLAGRYHLVATNVPYLARGKQGDSLRSFCMERYPEAKNDLATVFLERCLQFCQKGGTVSIVLPQNWLFLTSYRKLREKLLKQERWHLVARLGAGAFETISGEVVKAILITLSHWGASGASGGLFGRDGQAGQIRGVDVSGLRTAFEKARALGSAPVRSVSQAAQLDNPDARVALEEGSGQFLVSKYACGYVGIQSGDSPRHILNHWETGLTLPWNKMAALKTSSSHFFGLTQVMRWGQAAEEMVHSKGFRIQGLQAYDRLGVIVNCMRELPAALYNGCKFDNNAAAIIPKNPDHLPAIWCFCSSPEYNIAVRQIDQSLKVTNATLVKVPFDLEYWTKVAEEKYPHGLPLPYSDDPTQWIFHGHPCGSVVWDEEKKWTSHGHLRVDDTVVQVATARLLGYRWPAELDPEMELAEEQREWVQRCESLLPLADRDGIVCIPAVGGEPSASDRLLSMLAAAYGPEWSAQTLGALLRCVDCADKTLEDWLRDRFFAQHCKLFQHRPFIWQIWDGLQGGFSALVNYHKLNRKNLESLTYTYLGNWMARQKQDITNGVDGAEEKLAAAENLKKRLELILEGEAPYDIFVRWKPLEEQPIGWEPDINDGVRLNIRPFVTAQVLRHCKKPHLNISWDKDRGKDTDKAPWFHLFGGDRINDHHLKLSEKLEARKRSTGA